MSAMCLKPISVPQRILRLRAASPRPGVKCERGFAIVAAIFLLVVLSALGAFMMTFSSVQHTTSSQDVLGSRAYQAARAGIEWGAFHINNLSSGAICGAVPVSTTISPLSADLAPYTVTVTCQTFSPANENGAAIPMYQLTSTASRGVVGTAVYVERRLSATL